MAVTYRGNANTTGSTAASTLSVSYTVGGATNNYVVCIAVQKTVSGHAAGYDFFQYGGTNLTIISTGGSSNCRYIIGGLANPSTASTIAEISWNSSNPVDGHNLVVMHYSGVHQTVPYANFNKTTGISSKVSTTIDSTDGAVALSAFMQTRQTGVYPFLTTEAYLRVVSLADSWVGTADTHKSGTVTHEYTAGGNFAQHYILMGMSILPASTESPAASSVGIFNVILMG